MLEEANITITVTFGFRIGTPVLVNIVILYKQLSICISDEDRKRIKD